MSLQVTREEWEFAQRLLHDYDFFARHCQKIEPKDLDEEDEFAAQLISAMQDDNSTAGMIPLILQPGQRKLHDWATEMKIRRGLIRAALVKPRQLGWSTIIQGRAHWLATKTPGLKIHTVSHTSESTAKFLRRFKKMCLAAPPTVTQGRQVENSKEIIFANGASHSIATAGTPEAVRSDSCHILHGSELPYWKFMVETFGALIPALSGGPGSEGWLESSSKGKGTPWHLFIQEARAGQNEWEVFFDAWFNHPRYRTTPPPGWEMDDEARACMVKWNLSLDQMYWRAMMIKSLRALWLFKQEFPTTIDESFQSPEDTLYNPDAIDRARMNHGQILADRYAPLIIGCDPARVGDRTAIAFRQGNVLHETIKYPKMDDMRLVGILADYMKRGYNGVPVKKVFIDYAIGEGVASRLRELGFGRIIQAVHFSEAPMEPRYANKRTEMFMRMGDWFGETGDTVSIPDDDDLVGDLLCIPGFVQSEGSEKIKLVSKDVIKKLYGKSPDIADACALTFAYEVQGEKVAELQKFARDNFGHLPADELSRVIDDFAK